MVSREAYDGAHCLPTHTPPLMEMTEPVLAGQAKLNKKALQFPYGIATLV